MGVKGKKSKLRNVIIIVFSVILLIILIIKFFVFPNGIVSMKQYEMDFFGDQYYELYSFQLPTEKAIGEEIAERARTCMEYLGTEENAPETDALSIYCHFGDPGRDKIKRKSVSVSMKKTTISADKGSVWVVYTEFAYDENDNRIYGSLDVLARFAVERDKNGKWIVTSVNEPP